MRIALISILIFLWAIWFEVAEIRYGEGFVDSKNWEHIGEIGLTLIIITIFALFIDWTKKKEGK